MGLPDGYATYKGCRSLSSRDIGQRFLRVLNLKANSLTRAVHKTARGFPSLGAQMDDTPESSETPVAPAPAKKKRNKVLIALLVLILVPVVIVALWIWVALGYTYASGERAGYVQKISKKGWICKTWEGELAMANLPGTMPQIFAFTVRNDSIAHVIEQNAGKQVSLTYDQHRGVPTSCFGETEYFVTGVHRVGP
jgi:hypothetical protein